MHTPSPLREQDMPRECVAPDERLPAPTHVQPLHIRPLSRLRLASEPVVIALLPRDSETRERRLRVAEEVARNVGLERAPAVAPFDGAHELVGLLRGLGALVRARGGILEDATPDGQWRGEIRRAFARRARVRA